MAARAWHRSLYWRIALGFILFLGTLLVIQAALFVVLLTRSGNEPGRSLGEFAALVAANVGAALSRDQTLELETYLREHYDRTARSIFIVQSDGTIASTSGEVPPPFAVRAALGRLRAHQAFGIDTAGTLRGRRFMGLAPVRTGERVVGMVVVLSDRAWLTLLREFGPILLVISIALLLTGTVAASYLIFGPPHRRLQALEEAVGRFGSGDVAARAPEAGGDEIALVARAFNRMASDLTARQEDLQAADRVRRQLLADVSHELMTPLTAIRGYVETLTMPQLALDASTRSRYLAIVNEETVRLERIVGDLLELARLDTTKLSMTLTDVPVQALFDRVLSRHERTSQERGVTLSAHVGGGADTVHADADRLEQAVQNLAANAIRHSQKGDRVTLESAIEGESVVLRVCDSGEGIAPEHLPRVFDRFYKADASRGGGGSGLGLSIVKAIAERHGGTITVTSDPGRETVFEIRLPR